MRQEKVSIQLGIDRLEVDPQVFEQFLWQGVEKALRAPIDPSQRGIHDRLMIAVEGILHWFGPKVLKRLFPANPEIQPPKHGDKIEWYMRLMVVVMTGQLARQGWRFEVDGASVNEQKGITYQVRGITAVAAESEKATAAGSGEGQGAQPALSAVTAP